MVKCKKYKKIVSYVQYCAQCPNQDNMYCVRMERDIPLWNMYHTFPKWCELETVDL